MEEMEKKKKTNCFNALMGINDITSWSIYIVQLEDVCDVCAPYEQ